MTVYQVNPLTDSRWDDFLKRNPRASVFHSRAWLEALHRCYGYEPIAFTTSDPHAELRDALVCCRIQSWLTGRRLVSLPFSDHCEPLLERAEELAEICRFLRSEIAREHWGYVEIRPTSSRPEFDREFEKSEDYYLHRLNLSPSLDQLLKGFHKDCVRRKIRRAEREGLTYEEGRTEALLNSSYRLLLLTRRRHQAPIQPLAWFRHLIDCMGDRLTLRVASKGAHPVACILTLAFKDTVVYKYGGSDAKFNNLGGTILLFWKTIQQAKHNGATEFDLGRSDCDNEGLVAFKEHWGAVRSPLTYWRYPGGKREGTGRDWKMQIAKQLFAIAPDSVLTRAGKLLYRHMG
jgi:hypothetical protein